MTIGTGATGVSLLQEYGIRTPELRYFIDYCKSTPVADLSVDMAIAPQQVYLGFPDRIGQAYQRVLDRLPYLEREQPSGNDLVHLRNMIDDLYTLLYEMYTTVKSGNVRFEHAASAIHA